MHNLVYIIAFVAFFLLLLYALTGEPGGARAAEGFAEPASGGKEQEKRTLERLVMRANALLKHLEAKAPSDARVERFRERWSGNLQLISDAPPDPTRQHHAAFTLDKQDIYMCVRDPRSGALHGDDVSMFVLVHELAHLVSEDFGHESEFWDNMSFLLYHAERAKLSDGRTPVYTDQEFERRSSAERTVTFCGQAITRSPLPCDQRLRPASCSE